MQLILTYKLFRKKASSLPNYFQHLVCQEIRDYCEREMGDLKKTETSDKKRQTSRFSYIQPPTSTQ